jgi:hypothetical protein
MLLPRKRLKLARGAKDNTLHLLHCTEVSQQTDAMGQERPIPGVRAMSAVTPRATG